MPDALLVKPVGAESRSIEDLCSAAELRLKTVHSLEHAAQWIDLRSFDLVFLHAHLSPEKRVDFADRVWRKDPLVHIAVFDFDGVQKGRQNEGRLAGFEMLGGDKASKQVEELIRRASFLKSTAKDLPRIMVVEDLDSPRDIICSYVEALGVCNAVGQASAKEALENLEADPEGWSCIITDIRMPEIDGKEFLEIVRQHDKLKNLPVIVLTAYGTSDILIDCLKAGASGFMVKPPRKQDLVREISRALRIHRTGSSPRLASHDEAELIQRILVGDGTVEMD